MVIHSNCITIKNPLIKHTIYHWLFALCLLYEVRTNPFHLPYSAIIGWGKILAN